MVQIHKIVFLMVPECRKAIVFLSSRKYEASSQDYQLAFSITGSPFWIHFFHEVALGVVFIPDICPWKKGVNGRFTEWE